MVAALGVLAGIVGIVAYVPYVRDIIAGRTQPERASWIIWSVEYSGLFLAQLAEGATSSLWLIGLQLIGVAVVCVLAIRYGSGALCHRDTALLACACLALAAWFFTKNASTAILLLVGIETTAVVPTIIKVYKQPGSETLTTWSLIGSAGLLALPAVGGSAAIILYAYPVSLVAINFGVVGASLLGKRNTQLALAEEPETD